jgi:hypothetical protein
MDYLFAKKVSAWRFESEGKKLREDEVETGYSTSFQRDEKNAIATTETRSKGSEEL